MNYPVSHFHPLRGDMEGRYSVRLTANYRVTFGWDEDGAVGAVAPPAPHPSD